MASWLGGGEAKTSKQKDSCLLPSTAKVMRARNMGTFLVNTKGHRKGQPPPKKMVVPRCFAHFINSFPNLYSLRNVLSHAWVRGRKDSRQYRVVLGGRAGTGRHGTARDGTGRHGTDKVNFVNSFPDLYSVQNVLGCTRIRGREDSRQGRVGWDGTGQSELAVKQSLH